MNVEEKKPVDKYTDTHWNAKDGNGEFNWRFIYNVNIIILDKITYKYPSYKCSTFE